MKKAFVFSLFLTALLFGQFESEDMTNPSRSPGFAGPMEAQDIDSVNLFNGATGMAIPIGPAYQVGPLLSQQLSLVYDSSIWRRQHGQYYPDGSGGCTTAGGSQLVMCDVSVSDNNKVAFGMGWSIQMGKIGISWVWPGDNTVDHIVGSYYEPDGTKHRLYYEKASSRVVSRDSTYLKLDYLSGTGFTIKDGNGVTYEFAAASKAVGTYGVTKIADPYGNYIIVVYDDNPTRISAIKTFTMGMAQPLDRVTFSYVPYNPTGVVCPDGTTDGHNDFDENIGGKVISSISFLKTDGTWTAYALDLQPVCFDRPDDFIGDFCYTPQCNDSIYRKVTQPFLKAIILPDATKYRFEYCPGLFQGDSDALPLACSLQGSWEAEEIYGKLSVFQLPTGGIIQYEYQTIYHHLWTDGDPCPVLSDKLETFFTGLAARRVLDQAGTELGRTTYAFDLFDWLNGDPATSEFSTVVKVYDNNDTAHANGLIAHEKHYFLPGSEWEPYIDLCAEYSFSNPPVDYGRIKRTEWYDGEPGALLKTVEYGYEWDAWSGGAPCSTCTVADRNPRQIRTVTTHYDSGGTPVDVLSNCNEQYQQYGRYKYAKIKDGDCSGTVKKTIETNWLAPDPSVWLLHLYDKIKTTLDGTNGQVAALTKYSFDSATGYLKAKCDYKIWSVATEGATCAVAGAYENTPNHSIKTIYIDPGPVSGTTDGLPSFVEIYNKEAASVPDPNFRLHHHYQSGVLSQTRYQQKVGANWSDLTWYAFKQDINGYALLPTQSYDSTGLPAASTALEYDPMGRVTAVKPTGESDISIQYVKDADGFFRRVVVLRDGKVQGETVLDDYGRAAEERKTLPGETYTKRRHQYDVLGREVFVSSWTSPATDPTAGARTTYDALGRTAEVTLNGADPVTYTYTGSRSQTTQRYFAAESDGNDISRTLQNFDALGRLTDVVVKNGLDIQVGPATHYTYSLSGNPLSVAVTGTGGTQTRTFAYDLLGRQTYEDHPEGKRIWYGDASNPGYDALGNVVRKKVYNGGSKYYYYTYTYDSGGRLKKEEVSATGYPGATCNPANGCYLTKELTYDTSVTVTDLDGAIISSNIPTGSAQGKLVSAKAFNIFDGNKTVPLGSGCPVGRASLTDVYLYNGARGRLSERRLYSENFRRTSATSGDYFYFKWGFNTDSYGRTSQITYPDAYLATGGTPLNLTTGINRTLDLDYYPTAINHLERMGLAGTGSADVIQSVTYAAGGGAPEEVVYGNTSSGMTYGYDSLNRLQDLYGYTSLGYILKQLSMQYDGSGNLYYFHNADVLKPVGEFIRPCRYCVPLPKRCIILYRNYFSTYDALSRLKGYQRTEAMSGWHCPPPITDKRTWTYDDFGNLTQICTDSGDGPSCTTQSPSPTTNRLTNMVYDGRGNVFDPDGLQNHLYSPGNQMNNYLEEGTYGTLEVQHLFGHDAGGRRVLDSKRFIIGLLPGCDTVNCWCYDKNSSSSVWAQDTIAIRDESGKILSEFDRKMDQAGNYTYEWRRNNYYLFGKMVAADGILDDLNDDGTPETLARRYYFHDHLGSLRGVIDAQDTYLNTMEYWPFGENMYSESFNEDSYRYTGHERDYDLDLDYMHARHYDYFRGRFMSPDPVYTGSGNLYTYVGNNPLNFTDPWGLLQSGPTSSPIFNEQHGENTLTPQQCEAAGCEPDGNKCWCETEDGGVVDVNAGFGEDILVKGADPGLDDPSFWRFLLAGMGRGRGPKGIFPFEDPLQRPPVPENFKPDGVNNMPDVQLKPVKPAAHKGAMGTTAIMRLIYAIEEFLKAFPKMSTPIISPYPYHANPLLNPPALNPSNFDPNQVY